MSFTETVKQNWDQLHILSQLFVIIAQSTLDGTFAHISRDFFDSDEEDDDEDLLMHSEQKKSEEEKYQNTLNLMYKIMDRILEIGNDIDQLPDIHCAFYWISRQDDIDLDKLQIWGSKIIKLCDALSVQIKS